MRITRPLLAGFVALMLATPVFADDTSAAAPVVLKSEVVATVNGTPITQSDVDQLIASLPAQAQAMPREMLEPRAIDQLVSMKLIVDAANAAKVSETETYKKNLKLAQEAVLQQTYVEEILAKKVTDKSIRTAYDDYLKSNPPGDEIHARHILVESEDEAKAIIADLKKGAKFEDLAKKHSTDKGSGAQGGDLGFFGKGQMVKSFEEAAFSLKKNEVTPKPVKSEFGYHIIQMLESRKAEAPSFDSMKEELSMTAKKNAIDATLDDLKKNAKITYAKASSEEKTPAKAN